MNEDLVVQIWFHLTRLLNQVTKLRACSLVLLRLSVNDVDERTTLGYLPVQVLLENVVAREIYHVEVDIVIGVDLLDLNLLGGQQEEGFVRC